MRNVLLIILIAATGFGQTRWTWKMKPSRSKHPDGGPVSQSLVIRYEAHPEVEMVTIASEPDLVKVYLRYGKRSTP
jgi:hypothetical protein